MGMGSVPTQHFACLAGLSVVCPPQAPASLMVALFACFGLPAYQGSRLVAVAAMLWASAPASLCLTYLVQAAFEVARPPSWLSLLLTTPAAQRTSKAPFSVCLAAWRKGECGALSSAAARPSATSPVRPTGPGPGPQDEVRALTRVNSLFFTSGYLGYLAVWILDTIQRCVCPAPCFRQACQERHVRRPSGSWTLCTRGAAHRRGPTPSLYCHVAGIAALLAARVAISSCGCHLSNVGSASTDARTPPTFLSPPTPPGCCPRAAWTAPVACCAACCRRCRPTSAWRAACIW